MSSRLRDRLTRSFGVRLALWYFALFAAGSVLILALAYALLGASLRARDRALVESTLVRYARAYERGGLAGLNRIIATDRQGGEYEPLFVRVRAGDESATFFSTPGDWPGDRLEITSARLPDGTLFQVGKSTRSRDELLERFRGIALMLLGAIVLAGLAGGRMLTWSALEPLRSLATTVESILRTGRTHARVPVPSARDELADLGALINRMLDRIDHLIAGMRGSLDNVAHDLRTPVTRLRATAETALRNARSEAELRDALADCLEEAERVTATLDALMDIAEAETGAMRLKVDTFDLADAVRDAVDLYSDLAEHKQLRIETSFGGGTGNAEPGTQNSNVERGTGNMELAVYGDRARLTQALANLVDNAVKYTPSGGRITVSAASSDSEVSVEVADTGIGIAEDELPRIWERLFRGDRSRSERGLGLGLSLVRAIVEAHGGRVDVRSEPGRGSTFTVFLRRDQGPVIRVSGQGSGVTNE
jgi:signal transduction histidine kinase